MSEEYYCPNCNAVLNEQDGFDPSLGAWTCTECGETLYGDDVEQTMVRFDGTVWYCDDCNAILNTQAGFSDLFDTWCCTECGHENHISEDEIYDSKEDYENSNKHRCPKCGDILEDQYTFDDYDDVHTCTCCDAELLHNEDDDTYEVAYRCPNCNAILNKQIGFDDYYSDWECDGCGMALVKEYDGYHTEEEVEERRRRQEERRRALEAEKLRKQERAREKKNKRKEFYKRHWKGLLVLIVIICIGCFGGYKYYQYQKSVPVGISSEALVGQDYEEAVSMLKVSGFTSVSSEPKYDIGIEEVDMEGKVDSVSIDGTTSFTEKERYPLDASVVVFYHKIKNIGVPISAKEAKKVQCKDLVRQLNDAGFVNITTEPEYDLIKGWLKKEGSVKSITINGDSSFEAYSSYRPDAKIRIIYHALKKDKSE